jgi:dTDP-4-amino-4,6-dideoxygalactose transaminase
MVLIAPTRSTEIPLVDLALQHREIAADIVPTLLRLMAEGRFIGGSEVSDFEAAFAAFSRRLGCVGVGNGTDAVELMLRAAGIGPGDDVIVPANTFVATVAAVVRAGARPVFADCDPVHHLLDADSVSENVTPDTRAILAVHLYGQMAPMERLAAVADAHGVLLFEDAAQAHGATRNGRTPGAWGRAAATSFYPGKNLGAYGDGGAVTTDNAELASRVRALRNHGGNGRYDHRMVGWNSRLDTLQAAVLLAKLPHLQEWNDQRAQAARTYDKLLAGHDGVRRPNVLAGNEHVWHLYVVRVAERDRVLLELNEAGIQAGVHYPVPVHLLPGYQPGERGRFPNAELMADEILSLPVYPGITPEQVERVAETLLRSVDA